MSESKWEEENGWRSFVGFDADGEFSGCLRLSAFRGLGKEVSEQDGHSSRLGVVERQGL